MFELARALRDDTVFLEDWPLCRVLLMNDSQYPWLILVPRREEIREIYQLSDTDRDQLWHESVWLGRRLMEVFRGDKLNVAALGNQVPQLHLHHVVRYRQDPAWPGPIWGKHPVRPYEADALAAIRSRLDEIIRGLPERQA